MESKHFSHHHPLAFHQVHQGSQAHCSGCKTPATGNVYACWQCSYFLHEQCFRATRSLNHPSHPLHPLTLVPFPTYPSSSFFCNSCNLAGDAFSYTCSACEFDIHVHCALMPNPNPIPNPNPHLSPSPVPLPFPHPHNPVYPPPNPIQPYPPHTPPQPIGYPPTTQHYQPPPLAYPAPQNYVPPPNPTTANPPPQPNPAAPTYSTVVNAATTSTPAETSNLQSKPPSIIKHFSHPHALKQMEIEKNKAKVCSACECELTGSAYCCTEPYCTFNLHKSCFDSPREVNHKCHLQHPLTLLTAPPYSDGFTCNACLKDGKAFAYNCAACSYDLHIDCIQWPDTVSRPDHKHNLTLYYSSPAVAAASDEAAAFMCDVCKNPVHEMAWLYLCRECDFGTHLECVASGIQQQSGGDAAQSEEEELLMKFAVLQLLLGAQGQRSTSNLK